MLILGIDPGYERTGCAVLDKTDGKEKLVFSTCIISGKNQPHEKRLLSISDNLTKIMTEFKPDVVAIEKLFFAANQKTALKVAEARGVAACAAAKNNIPVVEIAPLEIKMALTGYGRAEKNQVKKMVMAILKTDLSSANRPKFDDEIDAIAIAMAFVSKNYPQP